jgi:two-component system response regulator NreC
MSAGPEFNETQPGTPGDGESKEMTTGDPSSPEPTDAPKAVGIVIADDHAVVRRGLKQILGAEPGFEVLAEASDVDDARRWRARPSSRGAGLGPGSPRRLQSQAHPAIRRSFQTRRSSPTMQNEPAYAREALSAGALGYVLKEAAETELVEAVHRAAVGDTYQPTARCPGRRRAAAGSARRPV